MTATDRIAPYRYVPQGGVENALAATNGQQPEPRPDMVRAPESRPLGPEAAQSGLDEALVAPD
jgi:hypothetical protein